MSSRFDKFAVGLELSKLKPIHLNQSIQIQMIRKICFEFADLFVIDKV